MAQNTAIPAVDPAVGTDERIRIPARHASVVSACAAIFATIAIVADVIAFGTVFPAIAAYICTQFTGPARSAQNGTIGTDISAKRTHHCAVIAYSATFAQYGAVHAAGSAIGAEDRIRHAAVRAGIVDTIAAIFAQSAVVAQFPATGTAFPAVRTYICAHLANAAAAAQNGALGTGVSAILANVSAVFASMAASANNGTVGTGVSAILANVSAVFAGSAIYTKVRALGTGVFA